MKSMTRCLSLLAFSGMTQRSISAVTSTRKLAPTSIKMPTTATQSKHSLDLRPWQRCSSAKNTCLANPDRQSCQRNFSAETSNELIFSGNATGLAEGITRNDNLYVSQWYGDDGTNRELDVIHGPRTVGSDLLYATQTQRNAFAAYTVWDQLQKT